MSSIELQRVTKRYSGDVEALSAVDLKVESGELVVVLGPSGCGKSTLLRCLSGLDKPTSGRVLIDGECVADPDSKVFFPSHKRDIGMVFQSFALWPHMTVAKNVEYPLKARGKQSERRSGRLDEVLKMVQCDHLKDRLPTQLSGGQQQRVALARALASNPKVLLLDEPLSSLDTLLRTELRAQLRALHRELGYTGVYVTHDQEEALALGTRVAVMRAGRVEQVAHPEELFASPATEYVATFLGIRNRLEVEYVDGAWRAEGTTIRGPLASDVAAQAKRYVLFLRPRDLRIRPVDSDVDGTDDRPAESLAHLGRGTVVDRLYGGSQTEYVINVGAHRLFATADSASRLEVGSAVEVSFEVGAALLYLDDRLVDSQRPKREPSLKESVS